MRVYASTSLNSSANRTIVLSQRDKHNSSVRSCHGSESGPSQVGVGLEWGWSGVGVGLEWGWSGVRVGLGLRL